MDQPVDQAFKFAYCELADKSPSSSDSLANERFYRYWARPLFLHAAFVDVCAFSSMRSRAAAQTAFTREAHGLEACRYYEDLERRA